MLLFFLGYILCKGDKLRGTTGLGLSVDTNLKYYSFARADDYLDDIRQKWDSFNGANQRKKAQEHYTLKLLSKKQSMRKAGLEQFCQSRNPLRKEVLTPSPEREPYREPLLFIPYLTKAESC